MKRATVTIELNDDQWAIIRAELPKGSDLRQQVADLHDDAMTWGQAEGEFTREEARALSNLGLPWLEDLLGGHGN